MKIGFIGTGNMGAAILKGYLSAKPDYEKNIYAYDKDDEKVNSLAKDLGIHVCQDIKSLVESCDIIILAVKPDILPSVVKQLYPAMDEKKILVSIAAGVSVEFIENLCKAKIVRAMPNTPALLGHGMSALCRNDLVKDEEFNQVVDIFASIGLVEEVDQKLMDCVTGVSGSSPAYVYLFIEALADAAVAEGMPRNQAYIFAAQAVKGAAEMVLKTGVHPGELKDMVCSPGGTTIEAVQSLEKNGFRNAVIEAARKSANKSKDMTR
ncbi:MAG: pyrroline-5-carboxylate reductase [Clostridiales bacterium]|jgi:pyrroline-5-carboxylate reductase|nr:pyrroline-5-carboxylate reductase [Clostridiales bacterium]